MVACMTTALFFHFGQSFLRKHGAGTIIFLLLTCTGTCSMAQSADSGFRKHEFGIDITNTLSFLKKNTQSYLLNYRYSISRNVAFRAAANFDVSNNVAEGYYPDFKVGIQKSFIDEKWKPYCGIDVSYSYFKSNATSIVTQRAGISPVIGVQYFFTKRISASTEASLNFYKFRTTNKNSFDPDKTTSYNRVYIGSIGMFLVSYHF